MPRTDVTLADRITILVKFKNQLSNTSYRQLAEMAEMLKSTVARVIHQQEKLQEEVDIMPEKTGNFPKMEA